MRALRLLLPYRPRLALLLGVLGFGTLAASTRALAVPDGPFPPALQATYARPPKVAPEPQLAVESFAGCLHRESATPRWLALASGHALSTQDGFLTFLSVYPNRRIPIIDRLKQEPAHRRWQVAFEPAEERLMSALYLRSEQPLLPGPVFREALAACRTSGLAVTNPDVLCATVILHNAFRTMGRHAQAVLDETRDFNPHWYRANPEFWNEVFPLIRQALISLRPDGLGDRFGEWYHLFGILAFAVHEGALRADQGHPESDDLWLAELAARANRVLNPILAGGQEPPEKARMDLDTLEVAKAWFFENPAPRASCETREAYVPLRP